MQIQAFMKKLGPGLLYAGAAIGVSNEGLEWPLHDETLPIGSPRGISNVLVGERAIIRVRQGMVLCVVTHLTESTQAL